MITGNAALDTAVTAMRNGCHDFLTKDDMSAEALNQAMRNAVHLARTQAEMKMQADHQREIIRQGLIAALSDTEVTGNVVSLVQQQIRKTMPDRPMLLGPGESSDIDALLASFSEDDDFIFH